MTAVVFMLNGRPTCEVSVAIFRWKTMLHSFP